MVREVDTDTSQNIVVIVQLRDGGPELKSHLWLAGNGWIERVLRR